MVSFPEKDWIDPDDAPDLSAPEWVSKFEQGLFISDKNLKEFLESFKAHSQKIGFVPDDAGEGRNGDR